MECWMRYKIGTINYAFYVEGEYNGVTYQIVLDDMKKTIQGKTLYRLTYSFLSFTQNKQFQGHTIYLTDLVAYTGDIAH